MLRKPITAAVLAAAVALASCGGDDADDESRAASDPKRYCALTAELDAAGEKLFSTLGQDASPAQFEAMERRFVERFGSRLDALERAAPAEIQADVRRLLAAQRQRAGIETDTKASESEASAAERRLQAFEKRNCPRAGA